MTRVASEVALSLHELIETLGVARKRIGKFAHLFVSVARQAGGV